jgi:hypothetical protein
LSFENLPLTQGHHRHSSRGPFGHSSPDCNTRNHAVHHWRVSAPEFDFQDFEKTCEFEKTCAGGLAALTARVLRKFDRPSKMRAQGKPDADGTRGLVRKTKKHTSIVTTGSTGSVRLSPREWF